MNNKGQIPWNKGLKGVQKGWNKGLKGWTKGTKAGFQKGHGLLYNPAILKGKHNSIKTEFKKGHPKPLRAYSWGIKENNPKWVGGSLNWANRQVRIRDNNTCQICGLKDEEIMQVDHIIPKSVRPDLKTNLDNLMTLCPNCHARKTIREKKSKVYNN